MSVEQAALSTTFPLNQPILGVNLFGVPLVIGAKKGYPNFNKAVLQTAASMSRRLQLSRATQGGPIVATNQMYTIGVSNRFSMEAWNSYAAPFNRNLDMRATNQVIFSLYHHVEGSTGPTNILFRNIWAGSNSTTMTSWPGSGGVAPGAAPVASSFVLPVDTNVASMVDSIYLAQTGILTNESSHVFESSFHVPQLTLLLTNRIQYVLIDRSTTPFARIIDAVNLDKLVSEVDLSRGLTGVTNSSASIFGDNKRTGAQTTLTDQDIWNPQHSTGTNVNTPSIGVLNQISVAKGQPFVGAGMWGDASAQIGDKATSIQIFTAFLNGQLTNLTMQVPFTPSRLLFLQTTWGANDPLVHYTAEDLSDPTSLGATNTLPQSIAFNFDTSKQAMLRQFNTRYRPWGGNPNKPDPITDFNLTVKDPLIRRSDDWQFLINPANALANKLPTIGWLGRVHRGTPWQTIYLKAGVDPLSGQSLDTNTWARWSGSYGTHPTNDWRLLDLFTVAPNDTANRGLLSVNQTNIAAWSAVLSGINVSSNRLGDGAIGPSSPPQFVQLFVQPNSTQMVAIVNGLVRAHANNQSFRTIGDVLSVPELTVASPFLNRTTKQMQQGLDDAAYERIPQQVLSLLKTDEPRVTVYAFGQALKPADRSLVTAAGYFNLCTNYQITGEFATKTVLRLESLPPQAVSTNLNAPMAQKVRAIVESYATLQSD